MSATLTNKQAFRFLSPDQLKTLIPSAFTSMDVVQSKRSERYEAVETPVILKRLAALGWYPVKAYEVTPKKKENVGTQKHFIHFRNENHFVGKKDEIEMIPEIIGTNSYNARSSFVLRTAMYRVVCENGMIVSTRNDDEVIRIRHIGDTPSLAEEEYKKIDRNIEWMLQLVMKMKKKHLTHQQAKQFAIECCRARWDYQYKINTPQNLLEPLRPEDEHMDFWTIFNCIQEKLVKGGWIGAGGKKVKRIKDPNRNMNINVRLFAVAEIYLQSL